MHADLSHRITQLICAADTIKLAENQHLPRTLRKELHALLEHYGVRTGGSLEAMIRPYRQQEDVMEFEDMFDFNAA